ncbi:TerC family protein [Thermoleophilum album]|uniref:TerC family protein n=1 Tax=Thermoleophilum album TaxID=29539 RepID=UPI00237CACCA|nr:TerC family protein [Thermoleophilum album]WDT93799.1 TerC family protein [Thermoleophilum album]
MSPLAAALELPLAASEATKIGTDLDVHVGAWALLAALVVAMIVVDFAIFGRGRREVTLRESVIWSIGWLVLALAFAGVMAAWQGHAAGAEYLAGYIVERSLSLDNIFVFAVIFGYFAVPLAVQPRVLAWGIALALVLRLVFIVLGAALLNALHITFYAFGLLLLYTAWKLFRHEETEIDPEHNPALRVVRKRIPMTADYRGHRLLVREGGRRLATPLVAVFVVIATTDIVFAIDSIPAIFAITTEPFTVFAANAFALLGMRALYFAVAGLMSKFVYLSQGLAIILGYIAVKMLLVDVWHPPIWLSLIVICVVLSATAWISLRFGPKPPGPADPQQRTEPPVAAG